MIEQEAQIDGRQAPASQSAELTDVLICHNALAVKLGDLSMQLLR